MVMVMRRERAPSHLHTKGDMQTSPRRSGTLFLFGTEGFPAGAKHLHHPQPSQNRLGPPPFSFSLLAERTEQAHPALPCGLRSPISSRRPSSVLLLLTSHLFPSPPATVGLGNLMPARIQGCSSHVGPGEGRGLSPSTSPLATRGEGNLLHPVPITATPHLEPARSSLPPEEATGSRPP